MLSRRNILTGLPLIVATGCISRNNFPSIMTNPEFASIEKRIGGRLGVALVDSKGGLISSHRGNERFAMCSTFKASLASALFAADAAGVVDMHAKFNVTSQDRVPYMPFVEKRLEDGKAVSLAELAKAAVQTSDNAAANLVLNAVGGPSGFTRFLRLHGDDVTRLDRMEPELNENRVGDPRDTTSPIAMARLMQKLLIDSSIEHGSGTILQDWMKGTKTGAHRIRAGLPKEWTVGNKTGTAPDGTAFNDIAIIWPANEENGVSPVLLSVYTDRPTSPAKTVNAGIADVARSVSRLII